MRTRTASLEQQLQAGEKKLKARESDLRGRLFAADERVRKASAFTEMSLMRQSALEEEVASIRD